MVIVHAFMNNFTCNINYINDNFHINVIFVRKSIRLLDLFIQTQSNHALYAVASINVDKFDDVMRAG